MNSQLRNAGVSLAAVFSLSFFTTADAAALNARAYVQSGLIGQLDAIANNGVDAETGEDIHGAPTLWADIAGNASMQKSKSQFVYSYGADYVTVGSGGSLGGVYFKSRAFVNAVTDRSLTLQMLVRETSLYASSYFVSVTGGLGIGDTSSVIPAQPFRSFMYRGKTDVLPFSTAKYLNRDVLLTVVIDSEGASLSFDDGPVAHVNAGGTSTPSYGSTGATLFSYAKGQVRSLRIYNRVLTASERIENALVDEVRYFGMDESSARSWVREGTDGTEAKLVVANSDPTVEYSIDGGTTWAQSIDTWRAAGETLVVMARSSSPGARFSWSGLGKNCVLPDDGTDATVTISFMRPLFGSISAAAIPANAVFYWAGGSGNFEDPDKWLLAGGVPAHAVPSVNNGIVIPNSASSGVTDVVTAITPIRAASLELGGGAGACELRMTHVYTNEVSGNVYLKSGAKLSHTASSVANGTYKMLLDVGGDMTIDSGASINVSSAGYYRGCPAGSAGSSTPAVPHGGCVYGRTGALYAYDSAVEPSMAGAGGYNGRGGGVVRLFVAGNLVMNGTITANGASVSNGSMAGAGGSVWIKCARLSGAGSVSAIGGYTMKGASGSGGRIAFHQTNPSATDFSAFTGAVNAGGGYVTQRADARFSGPAGTIYYQAYGETVTSATLVIDNKNVNSNASGVERYVEITPLGEAFGIDRIGNLVMRNSAYVAISNNTIKVYGDIIANEGSPRLEPYTGDLMLCGKGASLVASSCTFDSLTCMEPGKRIAFGTGSTNFVNIADGGKFVFVGGKGGNIVLTTAVPGEQWSLYVPETAVTTAKFVTVDHSDASSGAPVVTRASANGGANVNWVFSGFSMTVR